jgi:hypothetical protein
LTRGCGAIRDPARASGPEQMPAGAPAGVSVLHPSGSPAPPRRSVGLQPALLAGALVVDETLRVLQWRPGQPALAQVSDGRRTRVVTEPSES